MGIFQPIVMLTSPRGLPQTPNLLQVGMEVKAIQAKDFFLGEGGEGIASIGENHKDAFLSMESHEM